MNPHDIVIIAAMRTPIGSLLGHLSSLSAPQLGSHAHKAALLQARMPANIIEEVISGCVLQAGIGQAPARQAAISAHIPNSVPATTINKMCGSGMKAVMLGHDSIKAGTANVVLASGMESMSNAPYLLKKARAGYRLGHGELIDHLFLDGLEDAYDAHQLMGNFADITAKKLNISREEQDNFAITSMIRAINAQESGAFLNEIVPITLTTIRKETMTVSHDEHPDYKKIAKIPQLKPIFDPHGSVTAASSSAISDGAASLILTTRAFANQHDIKPLAKIVAHASHAEAPAWFTLAPIAAIKKVLHHAHWNADDVSLYEINEAFAVVAIAAIKELKLNPEQVNIHGGACALGHPIGASGARIIVTLLHALKHQQKKRGVAALCIGGGEATAIAIEIE